MYQCFNPNPHDGRLLSVSVHVATSVTRCFNMMVLNHEVGLMRPSTCSRFGLVACLCSAVPLIILKKHCCDFAIMQYLINCFKLSSGLLWFLVSACGLQAAFRLGRSFCENSWSSLRNCDGVSEGDWSHSEEHVEFLQSKQQQRNKWSHACWEKKGF